MIEELSVHRVEHIKAGAIDLQLSEETKHIRIIKEEALYKQHLEAGWNPLYTPEVGERPDWKIDSVWMVYKATVPPAALHSS